MNRLNRLSFFWLLAAALISSAGCPGNSPAPQQAPGATAGQNAEAGAASNRTAASSGSGNEADLTRSMEYVFTISQLGISTDIDSGVHLLNQWQRTRDQSVPPALPEATARYFSATERAAIGQPQFSTEDGLQWRDAMLFREWSRQAVKESAAEEIDQIQSVFDFVIRQIDLEEQPRDLPRTAYETAMLGRGNAADRAWILSGILAQLRIDSVVLLPPGESQNSTEPILGAVSGRDVYLFNPLRGVPVRSNDRVATLVELTSDPNLLTVLVGPDSPWTEAAIKSPQVGFIGTLSNWSPRMAALQAEFTGTRSIVLAQPLVDSENVPGLISRLNTAGRNTWDASRLLWWNYPQAQLTGRQMLAGERLAAHERDFSQFRAPLERKFTDDGLVLKDPVTNEALFGRSFKALWQARLYQLAGEWEQAIILYGQVRLDARLSPDYPASSADRALHERAVEDARYFTGLCQFEQNHDENAVATCESYLKVYPEGVWSKSAWLLLARAYLRLNDKTHVLEALARFPAESPQSPLISRLRKRAEAIKEGK